MSVEHDLPRVELFEELTLVSTAKAVHTCGDRPLKTPNDAVKVYDYATNKRLQRLLNSPHARVGGVARLRKHPLRRRKGFNNTQQIYLNFRSPSPRALLNKTEHLKKNDYANLLAHLRRPEEPKVARAAVKLTPIPPQLKKVFSNISERTEESVSSAERR